MRCVPISGRKGEQVICEVAFTEGCFTILSESDMRDVMTQIHGSTQRDDTIPVLDVDSFSKRFINTDLIKGLRLRGRSLWLISYIRSVDDVIDAMCGTFEKLCIPFQTVDDQDVLAEALEISDSIVPTLFVRKGRDAYSGGSISQMIRSIEKMGYGEYALFDVDTCELDHRWVSMVSII